MIFEKHYIIANTREHFHNERAAFSCRSYNDHPSSESIKFVASELSKEGYDTTFYGGVDELVRAYENKTKFSNALFLNFSDGLSQKSRKAQSAIFLEMLDVSYAGSDPLARLMAGNKSYAKKIVSEFVNVAKGTALFKKSTLPLDLCFPVIMKPNKEGSSLGISQKSICRNMNELQIQLPDLLARFHEVIVEEYIEGYEITCFIIGNEKNYLLTEPIICEYDGINYFKEFVFGMEEKANRKRKEYLAKNILNANVIKEIRYATQKAFELLGLQDYARADFRLNEDGRLVFLEINGNPVISETSEVGVISRELGVSFGSIVAKIIQAASDRLSTF